MFGLQELFDKETENQFEPKKLGVRILESSLNDIGISLTESQRLDIEEQFFYTVLQPVQDGLVPNINEYPGYNCFEDAIQGKERVFKVINWAWSQVNATIKTQSDLI